MNSVLLMRYNQEELRQEDKEFMRLPKFLGLIFKVRMSKFTILAAPNLY